MTVKDKIETFLRNNGRSKVTEIAGSIGYTHDYTRRKAKELHQDSTSRVIGAKGKAVPAAIINGEYVVLTGNRDYLLDVVQKHAPHLHSQAKSKNVGEIQKLIRDRVADRIVGGPKPWEFWIK